MNHINVYAQLIRLNILNRPTNTQVFKYLTSIEVTDEQFGQIFLDMYKPQQNQLIQELLALGIKAKTLAAYFKITPATVSYHKSSEIKSQYVNPIMEELDSGHRPTWTQVDTVRRKRRTQAQMQEVYLAKILGGKL